MAFVSMFETPIQARWSRIRYTREWPILAILLLASFMVYANAFRLVQQHATTSTQTPSIISSLATNSLPGAASAASKPVNTSQPASATPTPAPAVAAPTPACIPSAYQLPATLDLGSRPAGLTQVVEPTAHYQIYGTSASQLQGQIKQCAPKQSGSDSLAEFTAQTGYSISWRYDYVTVGDGTCRVTNAKLGAHIAMVLPQWQPTSTAATGLPGAWSTFIANLTTHEQGHADLDQQYAADMLSDLQNFPATGCSTIEASVNAVMQNSINNLNIANDRYDSSTGHGATQGAILP